MHALVGEQDHRQRVLGHRDGVGVRGGGDEDAALPAGVGDVALDAAGGVHDRAQPRRRGQHLGGDGRAAPAGEQDLGAVAEVGADVRRPAASRSRAAGVNSRAGRSGRIAEHDLRPHRDQLAQRARLLRDQARVVVRDELEQRVARAEARQRRPPQIGALGQAAALVARPPREHVQRGHARAEQLEPGERLLVGHPLGRLPVQAHARRRRRAPAPTPASSVSVPPWNSNAISGPPAAAARADSTTRDRSAAVASADGADPAQMRIRGAPSARALASTSSNGPAPRQYDP